MALTRRIGTWILGTGGLNLTITPFEERADRDEWQGDQVWRIVDVFTTHEGSWELSANFGSVDDWARTDYWQGQKFDGAGGSHHFFIKRRDASGNDMPGSGLLWSQNGAQWILRNAKNDGSENIVLENSYDPSTGAHGSWRGTIVGPADVLNGVDMPLLSGYTQHVSTFVVFQAEPRTVKPPIDPPPDPTGDLAGVVTAINGLASQVKRLADHFGAA